MGYYLIEPAVASDPIPYFYYPGCQGGAISYPTHGLIETDSPTPEAIFLTDNLNQPLDLDKKRLMATTLGLPPTALDGGTSLAICAWFTLTTIRPPGLEPLQPDENTRLKVYLGRKKIGQRKVIVHDDPMWDILKVKLTAELAATPDPAKGKFLAKILKKYPGSTPEDFGMTNDDIPETSFSDAFPYSDGVLNTVGAANWTRVGGKDMGVLNNRVTARTVGGATQEHQCNTVLSSDDMRALITATNIVQPTSTQSHVAPLVRVQDGDNSYQFWQYHNSSGAYGWFLFKKVAGTFTLLDSGTNSPSLPIEVKLTVEGSTLTGAIGGVDVTTQTDTDLSGQLQGGLWLRQASGLTNTNDVEADDYNLTDELGAAGSPWYTYAQQN